MKYSVLALAILCSSPALAATDWTDYLKGMQNGCNYPYETLPKKSSIPKSLHKSISKYSSTGAEASIIKVDIRLKDATAFGKSINRITLNNDTQQGKFHVYFNDGNFSKLKSKFFVSINGQSHVVGAKKAWVSSEYDDGNITNWKANSVPYKGSDWKSYTTLMNNDSYATLIVVHENGLWINGISWGDYGNLTELIFDSKNKRISCNTEFG